MIVMKPFIFEFGANWIIAMRSNFQMIIIVIAASVFVSGCIVYPKKVEFYDAECEIIVK